MLTQLFPTGKKKCGQSHGTEIKIRTHQVVKNGFHPMEIARVGPARVRTVLPADEMSVIIILQLDYRGP